MCRTATLFCLLACGPAQGAIPTAEQTGASVGAADREFARRAAEIGTAAAFRDYMDPVEGLAFTGSAKPARGAAEIFAAMGGTGPETSRLVWTPNSAWGSKGGDMGVTTGDWALIGKADGKLAATGRYVTVWRRDKAGQWKGLIDIGEADVKPTPNLATQKP